MWSEGYRISSNTTILAITIVFKLLPGAIFKRGRIVIEGDLYKTQPHPRSIDGLTLLIDTAYRYCNLLLR